MMLAREYPTAALFLERVKAFLFLNELENNLVLSSLLAITKQPVQGIRYFSVENGPSVEAAAISTNQGRLIVATRSADAARALAAHTAQEKIRTVFVPSQVADAFTTPEMIRHGTQVLMHCREISETAASEGLFRAAAARDLRLLLEWTQAFAKECRLDDSPQESEETVRRFVENRQAFVWETRKAPVAMAAYGGFTPLAARISLVYTKPSARRKGYGQTLVHRLTHRVLESKQAALLFADRANPTSVALYKRLGFETIQEFDELRFRG